MNGKMQRAFGLMIVAAICTGLLASPAGAKAPLAERIPADALIYVGWSGLKEMPGYEGSRTQRLVEAGELGQVVDELLPTLIERIQAEELRAELPPDAADLAGALVVAKPFLVAMIQSPTALYVGTNVAGMPMPKLALLCDAGEGADALVAKLKGLIEDAELPMQPWIEADEGRVLVILGLVTPEDKLRLTGMAPGEGQTRAPALAEAEDFTAATEGMVESAVMVHVNLKGVRELVERNRRMLMEQGGYDVREFFEEAWPVLIESGGLKALTSATVGIGFEDRDFVVDVIVAAPDRTGALGVAMSPKPLGDAVLDAVPATASHVGAFRFDLAEIYAAGKRFAVGVAAAEGLAKAELDRMEAEFFREGQEEIGLHPKRDVIEAFGSDWAVYTDASVGGLAPGLGSVLVHPMRDGDKAGEQIVKILGVIQRALDQEFDRPDQPRFRIREVTVQGVTMKTLPLPGVSPSLAIVDGVLVGGAYPQIVAAAVKRMGGEAGGGAASIRTSPAFRQLVSEVGRDHLVGFKLVDLEAFKSRGYPLLLAGPQLLTGFAELLGADAPAGAAPPVETLSEELAPLQVAMTVDERGWRLRYRTPYPGAAMLAAPSDAVVISFLQTVTLLANMRGPLF